MHTDNLINAISQDAGAEVPSLGGRLAIAVAMGSLLSLVVLLATLGVRPDFGAALQTWRFDVKLLITALTVGMAVLATIELMRPQAREWRAGTFIALPLMLLALAILAELSTTTRATWGLRAIGTNSRICLAFIVAFSVAPFATLFIALRASAPRTPTVAGAGAGLLAGSLGALLYAVHCFDDSPLFVALWYTPPVVLVVLAGAIVGRYALRW